MPSLTVDGLRQLRRVVRGNRSGEGSVAGLSRPVGILQVLSSENTLCLLGVPPVVSNVPVKVEWRLDHLLDGSWP